MHMDLLFGNKYQEINYSKEFDFVHNFVDWRHTISSMMQSLVLLLMFRLKLFVGCDTFSHMEIVNCKPNFKHHLLPRFCLHHNKTFKAQAYQYTSMMCFHFIQNIATVQ